MNTIEAKNLPDRCRAVRRLSIILGATLGLVAGCYGIEVLAQVGVGSTLAAIGLLVLGTLLGALLGRVSAAKINRGEVGAPIFLDSPKPHAAEQDVGFDPHRPGYVDGVYHPIFDICGLDPRHDGWFDDEYDRRFRDDL